MVHDTYLINLILFTAFFLFLTAGIQTTTKKITFLPYTTALLAIGALAQILVKYLHLPLHPHLSPEANYFVLLPLLLFESAMHINLHQFKLQFKTITFLATFGVLLSMFSTAFLITLLLKLPFSVALLFGSLISATDPIAVLSLFKSLGAPKRLALLAEGESMFNDATAVIAFRTISTLVLATHNPSPSLFHSASNFFIVFFGSILFGGLVGYLTSQLIAKIDNDHLAETTLTAGLAIAAFAVTEHFLHLSGVIATVIAGLTIGNLGRTKFSGPVVSFINEFWEYLGFLSVSLIFFFATFNLNFSIFFHDLPRSFLIVLITLLTRAISIYISFFISNRSSFFKNEPNVPLSWQHVLNWGGLRGIIPLVLVYSLPETFAYRQDLLAFTITSFAFSLLVNATTIQSLLYRLGLHLKKKEEVILEEEAAIFSLETAKKHLADITSSEFDPEVINQFKSTLRREEKRHHHHLLDLAKPQDFLKSLRLQAINIERQTITDLYHQGHLPEGVYYLFESELDIQEDALEYPEVASGRAVKGGKIASNRTFRHRLQDLRHLSHQNRFLRLLLSAPKHQLIKERLSLLRARNLASQAVIDHLKHVKPLLKSDPDYLIAIKTVIKEHLDLITHNSKLLQELTDSYPQLSQDHQQQLLASLIPLPSPHH